MKHKANNLTCLHIILFPYINFNLRECWIKEESQYFTNGINVNWFIAYKDISSMRKRCDTFKTCVCWLLIYQVHIFYRIKIDSIVCALFWSIKKESVAYQAELKWCFLLNVRKKTRPRIYTRIHITDLKLYLAYIEKTGLGFRYKNYIYLFLLL